MSARGRSRLDAEVLGDKGEHGLWKGRDISRRRTLTFYKGGLRKSEKGKNE